MPNVWEETMTDEICKNPWKKGEPCISTDIQLYITIEQGKGKNKGEVQLPICKKCWAKIADTKKEWGKATHEDVPKPMLVRKTGMLPPEVEKEFQAQDTMNIGKMRKRKDDEPEEEEEI